MSRCVNETNACLLETSINLIYQKKRISLPDHESWWARATKFELLLGLTGVHMSLIAAELLGRIRHIPRQLQYHKTIPASKFQVCMISGGLQDPTHSYYHQALPQEPQAEKALGDIENERLLGTGSA